MFTNNKKILIVAVGFFLAGLFYFGSKYNPSSFRNQLPEQTVEVQEVPAKNVEENKNPRKLEQNFILNESGNMEESDSAGWWLNSGGLVFFENGDPAKTIQGELEEDNRWHKAYKKNNSRDTDNGSHPQNIFRLVNRNQFKNLEQETYFRITRDNLSQSSYRNQSNGLLHFNRYQDGDNLYYTGIRVDGFAVIKKKIKGNYFTLAYKQIIEGKYNRLKNPNLLPENKWIGLKSELQNEEDGSVSIKVYWDKDRAGNWELIAEAKDDGKKYGKAFLEEGHAGIRTDFLDVEFADYKIREIN